MNNLTTEMLECFDFYFKAADQKRNHLFQIRRSKEHTWKKYQLLEQH